MNSKIKTIEEIAEIANALKKRGKKFVFTNGCFDLLHLGHVRYLQKARALGDALVVGLNSDESVRMLKGRNRPIVPENERAEVLAALECVDYIAIFGEKRINSLIEALKPDIYAKGGDYTLDTLDQGERKLIEGLGIEIHLIKKIEGASTTELIEKIAEKYSGQGEK